MEYPQPRLAAANQTKFWDVMRSLSKYLEENLICYDIGRTGLQICPKELEEITTQATTHDQ